MTIKYKLEEEIYHLTPRIPQSFATFASSTPIIRAISGYTSSLEVPPQEIIENRHLVVILNLTDPSGGVLTVTDP